MTNRKIEYWVIPPEADAEFAANMENVLETYEKPYNPAIHVPFDAEANQFPSRFASTTPSLRRTD